MAYTASFDQHVTVNSLVLLDNLGRTKLRHNGEVTDNKEENGSCSQAFHNVVHSLRG